MMTVYADGSFAQSFAGVGDQPVAGYEYRDQNGQWQTPIIPAGGSETATLAQHKAGDADVPYTIRVSDAAGNLVDVYEPPVDDGRTAAATPVSPHTRYGYDASGNEVLQVSADEQAAYAAWQQSPTTPTFTGGTAWTYDANGRELSRTLPDDSPANPEVDHYTYDRFGNVATHVDFDGNTATSTYVATGPHAGMLDHVAYQPYANAPAADVPVRVDYGYDGQGRPLTVKTTTYAANGTTVTNVDTTTSEYDATYGYLKKEETPEGTIWHVYDPKTGRQTDTYTDYTDTAYGYDLQGRLWTVTVKTRTATTGPGSVWSDPKVTEYTYDAAGNKASELLPNDDKTTYSYDALNRLTLETIRHDATLMETLDYNQERVTGTKDPTLMLASDGGRRGLVDTTYGPDGTPVTSTKTFRWTYDADGRLLTEGLTASDASLNYGDAYQFDLNGNRTRDDHTNADGTTVATTNVFDGDDQLKTSTTAGTTTTYDYDPNGSQIDTKVGTTTTSTYTYDVRNTMVGATANGHAASYVYDDAGNRVRQTTDGTTVYFLTDTANPTGYAQPIEERATKDGPPTLTYLIGDHVYGQATTAAAATYYLTDGHGSTIALTDASGAATKVLTYTAYGDLLNASAVLVGGLEIAYRFGGDAMYDPASGLYLHGDGTRGRDGFRFVEADDQGYGHNADPTSLHKYLYVGARPTVAWDPNGHDLSTTLTAVGISLAVLAFIASPNVANAPGPGDHTYGDRRGDMALDLIGDVLFTFTGFVGGKVVSYGTPLVKRTVSKWLASRASTLEFRTAMSQLQRWRGLSGPETTIASFLERRGRYVIKNAMEGVEGAGRQGDAFVDGLKSEFKTLSSGGDQEALIKRAVRQLGGSRSGGGQAEYIIIDARRTGLTADSAERVVAKFFGAGDNTAAIEIIGDDFFMSPFEAAGRPFIQ